MLREKGKKKRKKEGELWNVLEFEGMAGEKKEERRKKKKKEEDHRCYRRSAKRNGGKKKREEKGELWNVLEF